MEVTPLQLPEEPNNLKLVDAKTKINVEPNNMGLPLGTNEGRGPATMGIVPKLS